MSDSPTSQENIRLIGRWFQEIWNEGRLETVSELLSPDGVIIGGPHDVVRGPAGFLPFVQRIRGAYPDTTVTLEDVLGDGDKVAVRWSATMTHTGDTFGPPTGKSVRVSGMSIARFVDGQIVEGWDEWDQLGMLEQLGLYQAPENVRLTKAA